MKNTIKSLFKAVSVLKSFSVDQPLLSVADVSRKVGIPRPTAHRVLTTLAESGLLGRDEKTGEYNIGPTCYTIGSLYLQTRGFVKIAEPVVQLLNELANEAINMSILDEGNVIWVLHEGPTHGFRFVRHVGTILPAYGSAMGKALLSELPETELDRLFPQEMLQPLTKKTIATKRDLKVELAKIRKTGISFDRQGSYEGVEGFGSLVRDASGKSIAAVSIAVPVFRINPARRLLLAKLVKKGCALISYRLGHQDPVNPVHDIEEIRSWWKQTKMNESLHVEKSQNRSGKLKRLRGVSK